MTFTRVFLNSSGLTQPCSQLATMMKSVPPIMANPSALVTTPTPGLGKMALPKMSPAVKNRPVMASFGRSKSRKGRMTKNNPKAAVKYCGAAPRGVRVAEQEACEDGAEHPLPRAHVAVQERQEEVGGDGEEEYAQGF